MPTLRNIVSSLATDIKALNLDDRVSFRYLATKFQDKMDYFIRLDAKNREIFKDLTLWKPIHCIEFEDVSPIQCSCFPICETIKRSKIEIPEPFNTNYGLMLKLFTLDSNREFTLIRSFDVKDYYNREYGVKNQLVFFIENKHIYLPNTDIEAVKGYIIPKDPLAVDIINCELNKCSSPLDAVVTYPPYLITLAKQEVIKELMGSKQVVEDEKGDDNTNNKK